MPRCRCPGLLPTWPGSSAGTGNDRVAVAAAEPASRPCSCSPTCAKARRSLSLPPGSGSGPRRPGGMWRRPSRCWRRGRRSCAGGPGRQKAGHAYVVVDGTLIPIDRVAADRPFYSGKHKKHGMNLQVIASPAGDILWVSGALPGSVHDKKAEWIWGVLAELETAGLVVLADKGYQGSTGRKFRTRARTSRNPRKTPTAPTRNSAHPASARTPSSRHGGSSGSCAAAPGAPGNLPRPSTYCRSARHNQDGKGSLIAFSAACRQNESAIGCALSPDSPKRRTFPPIISSARRIAPFFGSVQSTASQPGNYRMAPDGPIATTHRYY